MLKNTSSFARSASSSALRVIRLRELRLEQVHHVLSPFSAWLDVRATVESLLSTGHPGRNSPCIGADALVEEVQWSMGERGTYYPTMAHRDPRMDACRRQLNYGNFVVLGRAFDRIVDIESDASHPERQRWVITRFGRSASNAHALLRHVEEIERRERAWKAAGTLPPIMVTPNDQFNEDYANLWHWSVLNRQQAPPATTSQTELDAYRNEQLRANSQEWHDYGVRRGEMTPTTVTMKEFDPKTGTIIVNSEEEAGRMLRGILGPGAARATSLNPAPGRNVSTYSKNPFANQDGVSTFGKDVVGRILITEPDQFKSVVGAYGMYLQKQNGGYNTDSLGASRDLYLPDGFPKRPKADRNFTAVQGAVDLMSFVTDVRQEYKGINELGQIVVYSGADSGEKYFEVIVTKINTRGHVSRERVLTSDAYYQAVMKEFRDEQ